jgi:hypothetical protein
VNILNFQKNCHFGLINALFHLLITADECVVKDLDPWIGARTGNILVNIAGTNLHPNASCFFGTVQGEYTFLSSDLATCLSPILGVPESVVVRLERNNIEYAITKHEYEFHGMF